MSQLLQNAVCGTAMILAVVVLRWALKDRLAPGARLALWAACLFRLLTPAAPESVLSLWGLGRRLEQEMHAAAPVSSAANVPSTGWTLPPAAPEAVPAAPAPVPAETGIPWEMILMGVWLAVGAVLAARYALSYVRTRRAVGGAVPVNRDDPRYQSLPRCARLREGPMDGAPLTFGAVRPTVVLFPGLDGAELECVLAHEGVHAARRDNLWHYITAAALSVFWWNPAVWLMAHLLRRDVELSCDRAALKKLGEGRRADYANALVSMATAGSDPAFCQTFGRKAAEERILSIMKYKKMTAVGAALSLALVLGLTAGFASNPAQPGTGSEKDIDMSTFASDASFVWGLKREPDSGRVIEYATSWSQLEEELADQVARGELTQEKADEILAWAKEATEDEEGKCFVWSFDGDSGLTRNENGDVYYKDEDGNLVKIAPENIVSGYIFPAGSSGTVEFDGRVYTREELSQETLEWLDWYLALSEEEQLAVSYIPAELLPEEKPDSDSTLAGSTPDSGPYPRNSKGETYGSDAYPVDGIAPDLVAAIGTNGEMGYIRKSEADHIGYPGTVNNPEEAMVYMEWCKTQPREVLVPLYDSEGNVIGQFSVSNSQGLADSTAGVPTGAYPVCAVDGCTVEGHHTHDGVTYCGGAGHHGGVCDGSCVYRAQQEAMSGGTNTSLPTGAYPVCAVDGCTVEGHHTHDGVTYCGGAGHHGGVCDGSCVYCAQQEVMSGGTNTGVSQYAGPASTSGHHSGTHHSSGHHGRHH